MDELEDPKKEQKAFNSEVTDMYAEIQAAREKLDKYVEQCAWKLWGYVRINAHSLDSERHCSHVKACLKDAVKTMNKRVLAMKERVVKLDSRSVGYFSRIGRWKAEHDKVFTQLKKVREILYDVKSRPKLDKQSIVAIVTQAWETSRPPTLVAKEKKKKNSKLNSTQTKQERDAKAEEIRIQKMDHPDILPIQKD